MLTIAGLTSPVEAWRRLDEVYGNRESAILSAIRGLRAFKPNESSDCDQVIEVARAVQKCRTVLEAVSAMHEFHHDRETVACVIDCLPRTVQDRWFHRAKDLEEAHVERSEAMLEWLEGERRAAVAVHLHNVAKQHSIPTGPTIKPGVRSEPNSSVASIYRSRSSIWYDVGTTGDRRLRGQWQNGSDGTCYYG